MKPKMTAERMLRKARMQLLQRFGFWGDLALRLKLVLCNSMPTTAVDAKGHLYYNESWVDKFSLVDAIFEVAHEIGHVMFRHHARRPAGAVPAIWNIACDQIIDTHLTDAGIPQSEISKKMVPQNIQDECRRKDGKIKSSEERYRDLVKKMKDCPACRKLIEKFEKMVKDGENAGNEPGASGGKGGDKKESESGKGSGNAGSNEGNDDSSDDSSSGGSGGSGDSDGGSSDSAGDEPSQHVHGEEAGEGSDGSGDSGEGNSGDGDGDKSGNHICGNIRQCCSGSMSEADPETVEEWKQHIIGAAKTAKMKGNLPACAQEFLSHLEKPSRDWRDIVRAKLSKIYRGRYTLKRPSRRSAAIGVRLPARQPKPEPAVGVIDCSGSIGINTIKRFIAEVTGIMKASGADEVYLLFHDTRCYDQGYFTKETLKSIKVTHGGTSHTDVWEKLDELDFTPGVVVCFTDLYSDQMQLKNKPYPIIWCYPRGNGDDCPIPFGIKLEVPDDLE